MVTFVQATYALLTFVQISNISAVTGPIFFQTQIFLNIFSDPNFFLKIFLDAKFIKPFQAEHFRLKSC